MLIGKYNVWGIGRARNILYWEKKCSMAGEREKVPKIASSIYYCV